LIAQELTCDDFKIGTFNSPSPYTDNEIVMIERDSTGQIETIVIDGKEKKVYETIEWIDQCTYRLKYDDTKMELDDMQKLVNSMNGVTVKHVEFENGCVIYEATLTRDDGEQLSQRSKLCLN